MKNKIKLVTILFGGLTLCLSLFSVFNQKQPIESKAAVASKPEVDTLEMKTNSTYFLTFDDKYGLSLTSATKFATFDISQSTDPDAGKLSFENGTNNYKKFYRRINNKKIYLRGTNTGFSVGNTNTYNEWDTRIVRTSSDCYAVLRVQNNDVSNPYVKVSADGSFSMVSNINDASKCKFYRTAGESSYTASGAASFFTNYVSSLWIDETNEVSNLDTLKIRWAKAYNKVFQLSESEKDKFINPSDTNIQSMLEIYNKILNKYGEDEDIFEYFGSLSETAEETAAKFNDNIDLYCNGGNNPILNGSKSVSSTWEQAAKDYNHLHNLEKSYFEGGTSEGELFTLGFTSEKLDLDPNSPIPFKTFMTEGVNYIDDLSYCVVAHTSMGLPNSLRLGNFVSYFEGDLFNITFKQNLNYDITELKFKFSGSGDLKYLYFVLTFTDETKVSYQASECTTLNDYIVFDVSEKNLYSFSIVLKSNSPDPAYSYYVDITDIVLSGTAYFEQSEEILEMLSKYDYIYGKYGSAIGEDFLNRFDYDPATHENKSKFLSLNEQKNSTWIIAVVSIIGLTSVGAYFFYRKRKEE